MGWAVGYDYSWKRDVGYGVPAECDKPDCNLKIDRGLSFVCGSDPMGGDFGCGLYFCPGHLSLRKPHGSSKVIALCPRCMRYKLPYEPKPDLQEWTDWKMTDESWAEWRKTKK